VTATLDPPLAPTRPWTTKTIEWDGQSVAYTIRPSPRARTLSLFIRPDTGLVVTIPRAMPEERIEPFLRRYRSWILRQTARLARTAEQIPRRWPYGATLPYHGQEHAVELSKTSGRSQVERTGDGRLIVAMRRPTLDGARRMLRQWYQGQATVWLTERVQALGPRLGVTWRRIGIRDPRHRWGSCSFTGHLSFNQRLIMAPPAVIDYVVVHELLHRKELNHSGRFWALVAEHYPGYREAKGWLKTYGPFLSLP